jgi:multidrug efflux pump subunit AcrA (membrane-fusion protein)
MKKILTKIIETFKSIRFNREKFERIIPFIVPEYWASRKAPFILFWLIGLFTIIFLIWGSIAEVNQVVKAQGVVKPDSKVHLIQSAIQGPIEKINIRLDDKVESGDILFLVDLTNNKNMYDLAFAEVETRLRKVEILTKLVETGSDSEFRLLDEKLALINAQTRLDNVKRNFELSSVKAPTSGFISKVTVANIGQVVQSGNLLAELVPENDILRIEAAVQPKDVAYVRKGQKAKIGFSAYDTAIYGQFEGKVIKIAANTSSAEDGATFYPAIIDVDPNQFNQNDNITLQSGMITDVSIIGEERTVLSYIMNPITKLSQRALQE